MKRVPTHRVKSPAQARIGSACSIIHYRRLRGFRKLDSRHWKDHVASRKAISLATQAKHPHEGGCYETQISSFETTIYCALSVTKTPYVRKVLSFGTASLGREFGCATPEVKGHDLPAKPEPTSLQGLRFPKSKAFEQALAAPPQPSPAATISGWHFLPSGCDGGGRSC